MAVSRHPGPYSYGWRPPAPWSIYFYISTHCGSPHAAVGGNLVHISTFNSINTPLSSFNSYSEKISWKGFSTQDFGDFQVHPCLALGIGKVAHWCSWCSCCPQLFMHSFAPDAFYVIRKWCKTMKLISDWQKGGREISFYKRRTKMRTTFTPKV